NTVTCLDLHQFIKAEYEILASFDHDELRRAPQVKVVIDTIGTKLERPANHKTSGIGRERKLRIAPDIAAAIAAQCHRPLWEIDFGSVLADLEVSTDQFPVDLEREFPIPEFIGIYLSALLSDNQADDLV